MNQKEADHAIETICQKGCLEVSRIIVWMKQGECPPAVSALNSEERRWVLAELQAIMAVYDHP